jgi:two-component system chemotaxis response regulator CheV
MPGDMESRQVSQGSVVDRGILATPKKSSSGLPEVLRTGANELEIVDFRIFEDKEDGSRYEWIMGVNVAKVREVLRLPEITKVPNMPPQVEGMAEIRGELIPVISLAKWMGLTEPLKYKKYVLYMEFLREKVGVIIHDAKRIRRISWADIKEAPVILNQKLNGRITGVVETEEGLLLILDFEGILNDMGLLNVFDADYLEKAKEEQEEKFTIYAADDSSTARNLIKNMLTKLGHEVVIFENGEELWNALEDLLEKAKKENKNISNYVQLVITDLEMPKMDGLTLTKKIKSTPGLMHIPVVLNTTLSDEANKMKAKSVGADDFIVKFDAKELADIVSRLALRVKGE